jgi:predicted transcriptional regulator
MLTTQKMQDYNINTTPSSQHSGSDTLYPLGNKDLAKEQRECDNFQLKPETLEEECSVKMQKIEANCEQLRRKVSSLEADVKALQNGLCDQEIKIRELQTRYN